MSLPALWEALNHPRRRPTPQSTIDAVCHAVKARGLDALQEPANIERLMRCDQAARQQINKRIHALLEKREAA
jgi:hypothetical protein